MISFSNKIKNVLLFLLCLSYLPFRGTARKCPEEIKKTLIFRSKPHVGDMVYITPVFSTIKKTYPDATVTVIGNSRALEVVRHNPNIGNFILYDKNFLSCLWKLRKQKPDFALLANLGSIEGFALLYLSGAKCISVFEGFEGGISSMYNILKKLVFTKEFSRGRYVPPFYLSLLDPIGVYNNDLHFRLYFSAEANLEIQKIFSLHNFEMGFDLIIGIAPGGSTPDRWWPAEKFAELANWLFLNYKAKLVFIGAGEDKEAIDEIINGLNDGIPFINLYNTPLDLFKASISKLSLIIGNDSGPMVTGDAYDIPQMIFIGPTDVREYHPPEDRKHRYLISPDKKMDSISLESAKKAIGEILDNTGG